MEFTEEHLEAQYQKYLEEDRLPDENGDGPWVYHIWKTHIYFRKRITSKS